MFLGIKKNWKNIKRMNSENKILDENDKFIMQNALDLKKEFFKSIFYLSTGMLALSITLTQANPTQESINTTFLFCSWILLGITTVMVILFYLISESRIKYINEDLKFRQSNDFGFYKTFIEGEFEEYLLDQKYGRLRKCWIKRRHRVVKFFYNYLSWFTSISFVGGFIFIVLYVKNLIL